MSSRAKQLRRGAKPRRKTSGIATDSAKQSTSRGMKRVPSRQTEQREWQKRSRSKTSLSPKVLAFRAEQLAKLAAIDLGGPDADCPLTSDLSVTDVEIILFKRALFKKFEDVVGENARKDTLVAFLQRNEKCSHFTLERKSLFDDEIDGHVKLVLDEVVHPRGGKDSFGLAQICRSFGVGPGASLGCELTDFLTKVFHSPLTTTNPSLYTLYEYAIRGTPWHAAEKQRYARYGLQVVVGGKLGLVPKNVDVMRTIETQPVLEMLFQKGIGGFLEEACKAYFNIDLSKQPEINKELARIGSMDDSREGMCTMDLVGASDCNSVSLCKTVMPRALTSWLMLTRTPRVVLPDGSVVELSMISSMGNAFTFPLQTMLFAAVVKACYTVLGIPFLDGRHGARNFGVFGDDIIVRRDAYALVAQTLNRYGFEVNDGKSFHTGFFRESCGGDFWQGALVRGVYLKSLRRDADILSAHNKLVRWCCRSGKRLDLTLWLLRSWLRRKPLYVPYTAGDTSGIKAPYRIAVKSTASCRWTRSPFYRGLIPKTRSYALPVDPLDWVAKKDYHRRNYNGDAILVTMLGGFSRDGRITLRSEGNTSYRVGWSLVPYWDWIPPADAAQHRGDSWEAVSGAIEDLLQ